VLDCPLHVAAWCYLKQTKLITAAGSQSTSDGQPSPLQNIISPDPSELPDDFNMPIWDHLEELRERCARTESTTCTDGETMQLMKLTETEHIYGMSMPAT
jgi:hypothetical protein